MATKIESDFPSSPPNDESGEEGEQDEFDEEEPEAPPKSTNNNVHDLLKRLQSSGALVKKPKQEFYCFTCDEDYGNWGRLEQHLLSHVSLPSIVLDKLPSDDEDVPSGDEWSDEDDPPVPAKTPQKVDISQLLNKTGLSIKKPVTLAKPTNALDKLSSLGLSIKKNISPIKKETDIKSEPSEQKNAMLQKLGNLGAIKLTLKSDGNKGGSFKVVNGLKDFKTSDDEDEDEDLDKSAEHYPDSDEEMDKSGEQGSAPEENEYSDEDSSVRQPPTKPNNNTASANKGANSLKHLQGKTIVPKSEPQQPRPKPPPAAMTPAKDTVKPTPKPVGRPNIKQTPKRGANLPLPPKEPMQIKEVTSSGNTSSSSTPERRQSATETVVVKKETDSDSQFSTNTLPLFSGQIKNEASSPPPADQTSTPVIASVKSEPDPVLTNQAQPLFSSQSFSTKKNETSNTPPLLPVAKTEDTGVTIIEINGDSNDEDDDCCVVSATPGTDVKPVLPKTEPIQSSYPPVYPASSQSSFSLPPTSGASIPAHEKQHSFNWNAPESKPAIDIFEKSADDIFESLISNASKKDSLSDASEYISLDTLGPQHTCDVCNTRFTDVSLLENHIRMTGHSRSIVTPSSGSSLMPYNPGSSSNILSSLLPVKQMVEQVGKIGLGGSSGFTHQQNVMINIQTYPGAGGMVPPQSNFNSYGQSQQQPPGYGQSGSYVPGPGQQHMPGQYPNQNYMSQQPYNKYQSPMQPNSFTQPQSNSYPQPTSFESPMYSQASPLQGMQQAVYNTAPTSMAPQMGQMGPPPVHTSNPYTPTSTVAGMMPPTNGSGIKIQNIQTFPPGQMAGPAGQNAPSAQSMMPPPPPGQIGGSQMPSPGQIRMAAGANVGGPRARMPGVRGPRPPVRGGAPQMRGAKSGVRMPIKRPGAPGMSPGMKKRPNVLLPGKHDNEDCQVMAMQKQREGMPMIKSIQGAGEKMKTPVNKEANAMANVLASRGISIKQKQKSRSPSPDRPLPHIPNLGAGMSIKHTSKSSSFSIPEAKVGEGMLQCRVCKNMFMNQNSLAVHVSSAHPGNKLPMFKCDACPASYPKIAQLQQHKKLFHNVIGPNRELGLPVVDISQEETLHKLNSLGIYSYIPLASRGLGGDCFGIPVISVHNVQNGMTTSLAALGADGLLSLGPLKSLPNT